MASGCFTGYIHHLLDHNLTLEQFVLYCAHLNDWEEGVPTDYHAVGLANSRAELKRLVSMSETEREAHGVWLRTDEITSLEARERTRRDELQRLREMLVEVEQWQPPSADHEDLKQLMATQIREALDHENTDYWERLLNAARSKEARAYFTDALAELRRDIAYYIEEDCLEREKVARRNEWARLLIESFKGSG